MARPSFRNRKLFASETEVASKQEAGTAAMNERTTDLARSRAQDAAIPSTVPNPRPMTRDDLVREISVRGTLIYDRAQFFPYNPDDLSQVRPQGSYPMQGLWAKHGPFAIYRRMRVDEQVKACLTFKKLARLSHGYSVTPFDKSVQASTVADFVKYALDNVEGSFHHSMKEVLSALDFGFSITEKTYQYLDSGKFKGKIALRDLKTRAPETFRFNSDEFGNIRNLTQFLPNATPIELPRDKFIIYTYANEFQNHYGQSDLRACYRSWWSKDFIIKAWNIFLDRYGQPTRVMKIPTGEAGDPAIAQKILKVLDSIQTDTSVTLPPGFEMEFMTVGAGGGGGGYQEALDRYDKSIAKALLYPELGGLTERGGGGSQHMADSQMSGYDLVLMDLGLDIEDLLVMDQIVCPLVEMNFGPDAPMPVFKLGAMQLRDAAEFVADLSTAVQSGLLTWGYAEEASVRKVLDIPEIKEEDWKAAHAATGDYLPTPSSQATPGAPGGNGQGDPAGYPSKGFPPSKPGTQPQKPGVAAAAPQTTPTLPATKPPVPARPPQSADTTSEVDRYEAAVAMTDAELKDKLMPRLLRAKDDWDHVPPPVAGAKPKGKRKFQSLADRPKTRFEKRIDFAQLETEMDKLEGIAVAAFAQIMAETGQAADDFVKSKKILEDRSRLTEILDFSVSDIPLRRMLETMMMAQYLYGKSTVVEELRRDGKPIPEKFAAEDGSMHQIFDDYDPKDSKVNKDTLVDFFKVKEGKGKMAVPFQKGELARIKDKFKVKAHAIAGVNNTKVLSKIQQMTQKAVDEGWSYDTWKHNLDISLGDVAGSVFGNYGKGKPSSAHHAKTTFRTILNETFNDGRIEAMKDESLGVQVVGVQFSAILDNVTTEICRACDQKYMKLRNPNFVAPPFHFNCRTVVIEVLADEDDGSIDWIKKLPVPPAPGFGTHDFSAESHVFEVETNSISGQFFEPTVIYTHRDDLDGLLSGMLAQRLAFAIFGKSIPVRAISYGDIQLVDAKNPAWFTDLCPEREELTTNPENSFFDHHHWDEMPTGPSYIEDSEEKSAAGVVASVLESIAPQFMRGLTPVIDMVQAGDLHKIDDEQYGTARDLQYLFNLLGFDAMWYRFAMDPGALLTAPELPTLRERRTRDDLEGWNQCHESLKKTSWGGVVTFTVGDWVTVMDRVSRELLGGKTVARLARKDDGFEVRVLSTDGSALKVAEALGGGGHPNAGGAMIPFSEVKESPMENLLALKL